MNRNEAITGLAEYALDKELIRPEEKIWAVNSLLDVLEIDTYSLEELQKNETINLTELLDVLLDDAYERGVLTENSVVYRGSAGYEADGVPDPTSVAGDGPICDASERIFTESDRLVLSVQSGHKLYSKRPCGKRHPVEDSYRVW